VGGAAFDHGDAAKKHIVADDKQERGEGAALLDAAGDVDPDGCRALEAGLDSGAVKEAADEGDEPVWEASALERRHDEAVVHRVEGLGGVHEENEEVVLAFPFHCLVVSLVEVADVIFEDALRDEALLGRMQGIVEAGGNGSDDGLGDDSVFGVGDGDGAGVAWHQRPFLGDEKEEAVVEAGGWEDA
jgi:hypothetical protein